MAVSIGSNQNRPNMGNGGGGEGVPTGGATSQVLSKASATDYDTEWTSPAGGGTVTSVAVSGTDGIDVDSGSPITGSGTIQLGINAGTLRTTINVENGATADQTGAEIKAAYEGEANTNAFTDAEQSKLSGIASGAEVNAVDTVNTQTGTVVLDADDISDTSTTNKFTTAAEISKLAGIETSATADQTGAEIKAAYEGELDTNAFTDAEQTKLSGIETSADVTDTTNVTAAGALMDSEVDADIKTLVLPANTTISTFGASLVDDASASAARTTLDVDQAGTDNSTDVTLAGTPDYITLAGQVLTRNQIDLTADVTGDLPFANITQVNTDTFLGRDTAGTGDLESLTVAQATALLNAFTSVLQGVVPASGGGTSNFLRADGTWAAPAGGGGGEPTENIIFTGTKTSGQNINGVEGTENDLTWDVVSQDTGEVTSFTTGDSQVTFTNAGWVNIHASAYISDSLMNNRTMISVSLYHYNTSAVLQYSYHGDMQYNRDDNAAYDASGGSVSQNMMKVAAGDYIYIRTRVFDDGTSGTSQTLDGTYSKLRIARIEF